MEIDDNDLGNMLYGLELDDIEDDLPNSTIVPDDHDLVQEGDEMQEDLPYRSAIDYTTAQNIVQILPRYKRLSGIATCERVS